jgi:hypothetical protein
MDCTTPRCKCRSRTFRLFKFSLFWLMVSRLFNFLSDISCFACKFIHEFLMITFCVPFPVYLPFLCACLFPPDKIMRPSIISVQFHSRLVCLCALFVTCRGHTILRLYFNFLNHAPRPCNSTQFYTKSKSHHTVDLVLLIQIIPYISIFLRHLSISRISLQRAALFAPNPCALKWKYDSL